MNFDTKYLIRWGLPGWIFILYTAAYFIEKDSINIWAITKDSGQATVSILAAIPIGIVVGYLIYQLYFMMLWLNINAYKPVISEKALKKMGYAVPKKDSYFFIEFMWHRTLSKLDNPDEMNYLSERYRHLLTKKHESGSLFISLCGCSAVSIIAVVNYFNGLVDVSFLCLGVLNFCLLIYTLLIFSYYSRNADYFMAENLKDLLEKKE